MDDPEACRYRLYGVKGRERNVLAYADTPEDVGAAIVQLDRDAREAGRTLGDEGLFGLLDVVEKHWIVLPFIRPDPW